MSKSVLKSLTRFLTDKRDQIVRTVSVVDPYWEYEQTYGLPVLKEFEVVDFDELLRAIDEFSEEISSG